jgi:quaternary ammonium compound-resistance protein SugE
MAWTLVTIAGCVEVVFALLLKESHGFTRLWPSIGTLAAGALSFGLLTIALKSLPVGTAYAVWTGIGAGGTVLVGILFLGEPSSIGRLASISLVLIGIIGLKLYEA